jgi:probable rRNA maturation factor
LSLRIFYDETDFRLEGWRKAVKILNKVIEKEGKISGDLNFIITNDERLREINIQFLEHDYYTDVITFNYNIGDIVNGEVYVSLERVMENALNYKVSLKSEILRVLIHGVLHLVGYNDLVSNEKTRMKEMEDHWLRKTEEQKDGFQI